MVIDSYTVIEPWTVMVESFYTSIADSTVFRSWSANDIALRTYVSLVHFRDKVYHWYRCFDVAWVSR